VPLLKVILLKGIQLTGASGHDVRITGDAVSHVEVVNGVSEQALVKLSVVNSRLVSKLLKD